MKLRQLDAAFIGNANAPERSYRRQGEQIDGAQGVQFQCPACAAGKPPADDGGVQGAHYITVWFSNPRGAPVAPAEMDDNPRWEMKGSSLDDLTLVPSINLDVPLSEEEKRWYEEHPA